MISYTTREPFQSLDNGHRTCLRNGVKPTQPPGSRIDAQELFIEESSIDAKDDFFFQENVPA